MSATAFKVAAHVALFLVALVVFYLGLGVGLQINPTWGMLLWVVAIALVLLNILWILRRFIRSRVKAER